MSRRLDRFVRRAAYAFEDAPMESELEPGFTLGVTEWVIHLRKACRALLVGRLCLSERLDDLRPYTVALECGFFAMERTLHAALLANRLDTGAHAFDHRAVFADSHRLGLWDKTQAEALEDLYCENRSAAYYRDNVATARRAGVVLQAANELHEVVVASKVGWASECICDDGPHKP